MSTSIESAALRNKAHLVAHTDNNGVIEVGIFVRGDNDCVAAFRYQPGNRVARAHGDKRIVNEDASTEFKHRPITPGSVALETADGVYADQKMDGWLVPLKPADEAQRAAPVAKLDYFTGALKWTDQDPPPIYSDEEIEDLDESALEAYIMGAVAPTAKVSYLSTTRIKAHTRRVVAVSAASNALLRVFVAAEGGDSRVRVDL